MNKTKRPNSKRSIVFLSWREKSARRVPKILSAGKPAVSEPELELVLGLTRATDVDRTLRAVNTRRTLAVIPASSTNAYASGDGSEVETKACGSRGETW